MVIVGAGDAARGRIRVLIADDQAIVRKGIRALLSVEEGIEVVGEAADGAEAVALAQVLDPDVTLMDLAMPVMDGIEAIRQIVAGGAETHILVLTGINGEQMVLPAVRAGALGYLLKDSEPADLLEAIRTVGRGDPWLAPAVAAQLMGELRRPAHRERTDPLTAREAEVLRLVARGMSNRDIAAALDASEATVKSHVSSILNKLHLANRVQATLYALSEGLQSLGDLPAREGDALGAVSAHDAGAEASGTRAA